MNKGKRVYLNKKEIACLLDLERRLEDDGKPFVQYQEDRLLIGHILDKLNKW